MTTEQSVDTGSTPAAPGPAADRIETLDVLRGVALLGILLMNILGFGLHSAGYFNPLVGADSDASGQNLDLGLWVFFDVTVEGAMRGLFSMLFGASLLLFTTGPGAKPGVVYFRRQWWLLCFGLFNGFILLWPGDILFTYALAGMLLYPFRHARVRSLLVGAIVIGLLLAAMGWISNFGLATLRQEVQSLVHAPAGAVLSEAEQQLMAQWRDFEAGVSPRAEEVDAELGARRAGYLSAFAWNAGVMAETLLFVIPVLMLWDALLMMLIGMALMHLGVISGARSERFYWQLLGGGLLLGVTVNGLEVYHAIASGFDPLQLFRYFAPSYNLGRLGMALAWLALVMLLCLWAQPALWWRRLQARLAAVGRTALSNYLMQSLLGLLLFSGAGLGLVGMLDRWQLYLGVVAVWLLQLWWTPLWLQRFRFGPIEWFWRWLTYGRRPGLRR